MYSKDETGKNTDKAETDKVREAHENTLKARDEEETPSVDPKKTGNKPRFDRDR